MMIDVRYYRGHMSLDTADLNLVGVLLPNTSITGNPLDASTVVQQALNSPIASPLLRDLSIGKNKVVIVTSDHTRPMPSHITMPLILAEIRQGNPKADILILVATGLHRPTTAEELAERFGTTIVDSEQIHVHNAFTDACVDMGTLPSGNSYSVNRLVLERDLLVCEGFIEPHFFAGFSGGRKSILPGVCSEATVRANHSARAIANRNSITGVLAGNPIHEDAVFAARQVGVDFILNVALDTEKRLVAAFAGDLEEAHLQGCSKVQQLFTVPKKMGEIAITSNGGYPLDQNLYQCPKALSTAAQCVSESGTIIMVASCIDGAGGTEFERLMLAGNPSQTLDYIRSLSDEDTIAEQWCVQILLELMFRHNIILVTQHMDHSLVKSMGLTPASDINEALVLALERHGRQAPVVVIPDGVSVMVTAKDAMERQMHDE